MWKNHGPSQLSIEYPSRDGYRICFHVPAAVSRGEETVIMEFVPPSEPSPPETIPVADFHSSFAPVYIHT